MEKQRATKVLQARGELQERADPAHGPSSHSSAVLRGIPEDQLLENNLPAHPRLRGQLPWDGDSPRLSTDPPRGTGDIGVSWGWPLGQGGWSRRAGEQAGGKAGIRGKQMRNPEGKALKRVPPRSLHPLLPSPGPPVPNLSALPVGSPSFLLLPASSGSGCSSHLKTPKIWCSRSEESSWMCPGVGTICAARGPGWGRRGPRATPDCPPCSPTAAFPGQPSLENQPRQDRKCV